MSNLDKQTRKQVKAELYKRDPNLAGYLESQEISDKLEGLGKLDDVVKEIKDKPVQNINFMGSQKLTAIKTVKGEKGEQGMQGEQGIQGEKGEKGLDGTNGDKGDIGEQGRPGIDGIDGKDGENGRDGSSDSAEVLARKLNTLEGELDFKVLKGTPSEKSIRDIISEMKKLPQQDRLELTDLRNWNQPGKGKLDQRWHGGGATRLTALTDVNITSPTNGQALVYNTATAKWVNGAGGGGSGTVTSVSVVTANGISGTVATATTTPAITLDISALDATKIANGSVSNTEFQYLDGVTSSIQAQINAKGVGTITGSGNVNEIAYFTGSTAIGSLTVATYPSLTELSYVKGVTSAIQTQLNAKQGTLTIGNLTDAGTDGITVTGGTGAVIGSGTSLSQHVADSTHNGYLSSTDWSTFNGKGSGTVTSIATAGLISGGTITTTGTITTSIATNKLVGRGTAGTGVFEAITLGTNLSLSGTTLNATGGSPGSPTNSVQFNSGGNFGGDATFTWDNTAKNLIVGSATNNVVLNYNNGQLAGTGSAQNQNPYLDISSNAIALAFGASASAVANGGEIDIIANNGGATSGNGGQVIINSGLGSVTSGNGGDIIITAGDAQGGNGNGGNVTIIGGNPNGIGSQGDISLTTSNSVIDIGDSMTFNQGGALYNFVGGSTQGILDFNSITSSNKTFTFPNQTGTITVIPAVANLTAQSAAKTTTTLFTPGVTGMYRVSIYLQVTTAASTSSVLGGATGVVITYKDGDGNVTQTDTVALTTTAGAIAISSATNTTATNLTGTIVINANTSAAVTYAIGYTSVGVTAMQYAAHIRAEAI